jgi:hypothetical protein
MEWTHAGRAHDCRNNKDHRIEKGQRRLTINSDGDEHHYCVPCARTAKIGANRHLISVESGR